MTAAEQEERCTALAGAIQQVINLVRRDLPTCREAALAVTKLEEATFWLAHLVVLAQEREQVPPGS